MDRESAIKAMLYGGSHSDRLDSAGEPIGSPASPTEGNPFLLKKLKSSRNSSSFDNDLDLLDDTDDFLAVERAILGTNGTNSDIFGMGVRRKVRLKSPPRIDLTNDKPKVNGHSNHLDVSDNRQDLNVNSVGNGYGGARRVSGIDANRNTVLNEIKTDGAIPGHRIGYSEPKRRSFSTLGLKTPNGLYPTEITGLSGTNSGIKHVPKRSLSATEPKTRARKHLDFSPDDSTSTSWDRDSVIQRMLGFSCGEPVPRTPNTPDTVFTDSPPVLLETLKLLEAAAGSPDDNGNLPESPGSPSKVYTQEDHDNTPVRPMPDSIQEIFKLYPPKDYRFEDGALVEKKKSYIPTFNKPTTPKSRPRSKSQPTTPKTQRRKAVRSQDDVDFAKPSAPPKPTIKRTGSTSGSSSVSATSKRTLSAKPSGGSAGSIDEEAFIQAFENVPKIHLFSAKELVDHMTKIKDICGEPNNPWEKRVDALKEIRSLIIAGATDYDEFYPALRSLEPAFLTSVKDLRSQVVREACMSAAYLSQCLGSKFDHCAEVLLPTLINLIQNSAKIMATSGSVCIRFIIQYTHAPRLIPLLTSQLSNKSSVIRRDCIEFLDQLLHTWPTHTLERHIAILQDAIKKGITDADQDARAHARKAYWGFADHFRDQAELLMSSLEPNKQKMLQGGLSTSSSSNSLNSAGTGTTGRSGRPTLSSAKSSSRSISTDRTDNRPEVKSSGYGRVSSATSSVRRGSASSKLSVKDNTDLSNGSQGLQRSSSATNLGDHMMRSPSAMQGTRARAVPQSSSNYYSLPRPKKSHTHVQSSGYGQMHSLDRSRPRSRIGVSQSQPSSRSGSPSSRLSYLTHVTTKTTSPVKSPRKSGIPRSQGASRETSPSRMYGEYRRSRIPRSQGASREHSREPSPARIYGRERKYSGSGARQLTSRTYAPPKTGSGDNKGSVMAQRVLPKGQEVELALADVLLQRLPGRGRYEGYESDDAASETSSVCSESSYRSYGRSDDITEILANLSSASWADRKEGLLGLQNMLRGNRVLNRLELKKITEIFTRMFHDPHSKVFTLFLETLIDFVAVHRNDLNDWLYILLTRLLNKCGAEMLGSVYTKVQRALEAVRDSFPYQHQFNTVNKFIIDQTTLNMKVKLAILKYMHGLIMMMDPSDFVNSAETRLAVSRIITWTTEPKSVDNRKGAQAVLIALFNLNTPEFSMMLSALPKTFQEGATKILHTHLRTSSSEAEPLSTRSVTSPTTSPLFKFRPSPNRHPQDEMDTENMNPEEIYNSIKQTSADIQNLSKLDFDEVKKERDSTSQDSGIQSSMHDVRDGGDRRQYNPTYYQEDVNNQNLNGYNKAALAEAVFDMDGDMFNEDVPPEDGDIVTDILSELSNHNERTDERKGAMLQLIRLTREDSINLWDEHFKTILLLLLETLGDNDATIRALSLVVLKEILMYQGHRFKDYAELTILKILEAHKDPEREVTKAAEECAATLANSIPPEHCITVLNPIIQTSEYPVNLAAIKMQTRVIELLSKDVLLKHLSDIVPGLEERCDDTESTVRKASIFSLVALYMVVGEDLRPHIKTLKGSKLKLLEVYIKRAVSRKGTSASAQSSKTTSPCSLTDQV